MADGGAATEGAERTRLAEESAAQAFTRPLGDDGNHAADGIRTPERRLRAAQNLDPLDVRGIQAGEVEPAARRRRIVDRHAVDQYQRLIAGGAADTHGGGTPKGAILVDRHPRRGGDGIERLVESEIFQPVGIDDPHGRPRLRGGLFDPRSGDDNRVDVGLFALVGRLSLSERELKCLNGQS